MSLTYKKADQLVHGAIKNLTCITLVDKKYYHNEQYYYVFWILHINKINMSGELNKNQVIE